MSASGGFDYIMKLEGSVLGRDELELMIGCLSFTEGQSMLDADERILAEALKRKLTAAYDELNSPNE